MKNEITSALIVATMVSALVWLHLPKQAVHTDTGRPVKIGGAVVKAFIISGVLAYGVFYFLGDNGSDDVLENIISGEPDF